MIGALLTVGYFLGAVVVWLPATRVITRDLAFGSKPKGDDLAFGMALGTIAAILWVLWVPFALLYRAVGPDRLIGTTKTERERELEARIRELERETGVAA